MAATVTLKLPAPRLNDLFVGIAGLDNPGEGKDPYKFSGTMRMRNARNLTKVRDVLHVYEAQRRRFQTEMPAKASPEQEKETQKDLLALSETEHELALETFTEAELQLERNPIPITVLSGIMPLLEDIA